ncbi:GTPase subunit of restriction endonuclease [Prevotella bivia DSM 20514]|uniref:GTPase subunit of restriction endonuclease n=3 Tax=Prevotella bivia TaxID=28125 RepID=I4ZAP3_9BACT|nr:GTPase subunit of restriction endonuclease [Prevotella bivia DSM 20514]
MDSRQRIKEEFTYYLSNIARSSRRTDKGFNLQPTAVQSFLAFLEVDRLFDYKPEIWKHIKSMYDITVPNEVENIADTLLNDEEFAKHDNDKNQRWRSGSIIHYVCFIKARSYFMNEITNVNTPYDDGKKDGLEEKEVIAKPSSSLQQIFYGAPGTGKSYEINDLTKAYSTIRTTFHPDSDYSTFVGAYKPTMEETPVYGVQGFEVAKEKRITYAFVKQAFLKAYLGAWQKYANGNETAEPQFLVIEEINRGNCAQIFGDLFQLLDRSDNGFSTYPIEADSDLQNEIKKAFAEGGEYAIENGLDVDDAVDGYTSNYGETLSDDIKNGRVLLLPNNLYIWATMNTSDQSLFPIDSAFKRRWDWRYVKIADAGKGWKIRCGNEYCDWWKFVEEINKRIAKETSSDDKKLGYFFCKPPKDSSEISEEKFVGKVLFYLWNDVFKDGDISLFKVSDEPEAEICFDAFYGSDNKVNIEAIRTFLVGIVGEENIKTNDDTFITVDENGNAIDYTKYSFDGKSRLSKKDLGYSIVMKYISEHSDKTFAELQSELAFDDTVDNKYRYKGVLARTEEITGSYTSCFGAEQTSSDGVKYKVLTWWNEYNIDFIIKFAKVQGWAVNTVTE